MKIISNNTRVLVLTLTAAFCLVEVSPLGVSAIATSAKGTAVTPFCTNLSTTENKINKNIADLDLKLTTAQNNRTQTLTANWTKADQTLRTDRANWASKRQTEYTALETKATTEAQKSAVSAYETAMTDAINTRETSNDAARTTYRSGVTNLVSTKQATTNTQVENFRSAVASAESAAENSCTANPSDTSAHTTFQSALKSARTTYSNDRGGDSGISSDIKALAQTRETTIKANDAVFQTASSAAETTLKAAFPKN